MSLAAISWMPRRGWSRNGKRAAGVVALAASATILFWVLRTQQFADILRDLTVLGFAILLVIGLHGIVIACDAFAWRVSLPPQARPAFVDFLWARWVREATNLLLPVAQIGGEVIGARILALRGLAAPLAGASVVVDKLSETASQLPFALAGVLLMFALRGRTPVGETVAAALAIIGVALAAGLLAGRASWSALKRRLVARLDGREPLRARLEAFAAILSTIYRADRFAVALAWHFLAWMIGAGEAWLALAFMGHPVSMAGAIMLESLSQAITSIAFFVPAALGVQEGAYIAIGGSLGLPPDAAVALSLVKRVRQLGLGLPALCSWQLLELRQWLGHAPSALTVFQPVPSSDSNSYLRQLMRFTLRPLATTGLTPNALTWLRIATGLAACGACCVGAAPWNHAAAALWLVSALLDRSDGEFARLTGRCSERGRRLDCCGDIAINALIFLAVGINQRDGAWGDGAIMLGMAATALVATASVLAEALEMRIGRKTVPSRYGFDSDDILFVLVPVLWLGYLTPLLVGASIGGAAAAIYVAWRLSRLQPQSDESLAVAETVELSQLP